jgi:hypothetical protein
MTQTKPRPISVPAALRLVDLIQEQVRQTDSELVKKILLRAGIKIADLALEGEISGRKVGRAA